MAYEFQILTLGMTTWVCCLETVPRCGGEEQVCDDRHLPWLPAETPTIHGHAFATLILIIESVVSFFFF